MAFSKDELVGALRVRYDAYSAEAVFEMACNRAGLDPTTTFDGKQLAAFRAGLQAVGDRVNGVLARIDEMLGAPAAAGAKSEPSKAESARTEAKADAKSETKSEAKTDAKSGDAKTAAKAEAKTDAKSEAKTDAKAEAKTDAKSESKAGAKSGAKADGPGEATIVLRGIEVGEGEQIRVCGAFPALGDWDPDRAPPMVRDGDRWLAKVPGMPDAVVLFKFLRRGADGTVTWEHGDDRKLLGNETVEATWRSPQVR